MNGQAVYLWIIEWDDAFVKPQRLEVRHVTRLHGVTDEALEGHLTQVEVPKQAAVSTRVGGVRRQLLVKLTGEHEETTGFANAQEGVATALGTVGVAIGSNAVVIWDSDNAAPVNNVEG